MFGRPQFVAVEVDLRNIARNLLRLEQFVAVHDGDVGAVRTYDVQLEDELVAVDVGDDGHVAKVGGGHALHPHALPYAGLRSVPYLSVAELLLAARVVGRVGGIGDDHFQHVAAGFDYASDVETEGSVAAHVRAEFLFVEPDCCKAVHRVEMQECVRFQEIFLHVEFKTVAKHVVGHDFHALGKSGKQTFGREGDAYLPLPAGKTVAALVDGIVPPAVERLVAVAHELRARIFRKRNVGNFKWSPQSYRIHNPSVLS